MSKFEKFEKELIDFIVSLDGYDANLIKFLKPYLSKINIEVDKRAMSTEVVLRLDTNQFSDEKEIQDLINITQLRILRAVSLIKYLESERYLLTFEPYNHSPQVKLIGQVPEDKLNSTFKFNDKRIGEIFATYFDQELVATPLLKDLVQNNYETEEERKFKRQQIATWISIGVAIILGLWGILFKSNHEEKLLNIQNQNIEKIIDRMDQINSSINLTDERFEEVISEIDSTKKASNNNQD